MIKLSTQKTEKEYKKNREKKYSKTEFFYIYSVCDIKYCVYSFSYKMRIKISDFIALIIHMLNLSIKKQRESVSDRLNKHNTMRMLWQRYKSWTTIDLLSDTQSDT